MGSYTSKEVAGQESKKQRYLQMSSEDRMRQNESTGVVELQDIATWHEYYSTDIAPNPRWSNPNPSYAPNGILNKKVSFYIRDITDLLVDVIVNSASKSIYHKPKGQVNNAICQKAGKGYRIECSRNKLSEEGKAMITGGYKLPAKYVINTLAPKERVQTTLTKCYENSLDLAKTNDLRTIAFPCIGVKKKKNFDSEEAAKIALQTVRIWLLKNHESVDRVIFCVMDPDSVDHYKSLMQEYFPVLPRSSMPSVNNDISPRKTSSEYTKLDPVKIRQKTHASGIIQTTQKGHQSSKVMRWDEYYLHSLQTCTAYQDRRYEPKEAINRKVALYFGNIAELEVDAIVNSVDTMHRGGQVNHSVRVSAGIEYGRTCDASGPLRPGEARIFRGYNLPAKFVINAAAPVRPDTIILNKCYTNSLIRARDNSGIASIAFPCISTRKIEGMDKLKAANIGLEATRDWLERNEHSLDLVVFCVYTKEDLQIYEQRMQYYFPC